MPEPRPALRRLGALDGIAAVPRTAAVEIAVAPPVSRHVLRLGATVLASVGSLGGLDLDVAINRYSRSGGSMAARLGPDEWLLLTDEAGSANIAVDADRLATVHHSMIDVSHRSVAMEVRGKAANRVLAAGCPLDLERMPDSGATRTVLGKVEIVLIRLDDGWRVECWRSFAGYVHAFLAEAAMDCTVV